MLIKTAGRENPSPRDGFLLRRAELSSISSTPTYCFPIIRIENDPGIIGPRGGRPAGPGGASGAGGPYSAAIVKRWFVFVSSARVFAPFIVSSVCSTSKLVGLFSLMNVIVPAFSALIASIVFGLNATVSTPAPVGRVVMILPLSAFTTTTTGEGCR